MDKKLEITKEAVLEAAEQCYQAKRALQTPFPGAFVVPETRAHLGFSVSGFLCVEAVGPNTGFGLHLDSQYEWSIEGLDNGHLGSTLVAHRKCS